MKIGKDGYLLSYYDDILNNMVADMKKEIIGFDETDRNPLMTMNKVMANIVQSISQMGQEMYNTLSVSEASGNALDLLVLNIGVTRNNSTKATGEVTFTGVAGTVVPSGFLVSDGGSKRYITLQTAKIETSGTVDVLVSATDYGANNNIISGGINKIDNPLVGVNSVINKVQIENGKDVETDVELRDRYYYELRGIGKSTITSIQNAIVDNTTASKVFIVENDSDVTVGNNPPHSFNAIVEGGIDDNILEQIYNTRPIGIHSIGDIQKQIDGYNVAFSRPKYAPISMHIKIKVKDKTLETKISDSIKADIQNGIEGLDIGSAVSFNIFISNLYKSTNDAIIEFTEFEFWVDPTDKKTIGDSITQDYNSIATIDPNDIVIEVIE